MKIDRERMFEDLAPPPGGLEMLRARLDRESSRDLQVFSFRRAVVGAAAAAAAATILLAVGIGLLPTSTEESEMLLDFRYNPAAVRLGLTAFPTEPVSVLPRDSRRFAVLRVEVADPRVVFYRVAALEDGSHPEYSR